MSLQFNRIDLHSSRKMFSRAPLLWVCWVSQPGRWQVWWGPGAQRCPLPSVREMTAVQGRAGPARGAAGQLFQGKRPVVPTRSHSAFCLFCYWRPRSGECLLDATRCRVWTCGARPLRSHYPCLPGPLQCTRRRRAAIAACKWGWGWRAAPRPVAGCWAVPADPSELTARKAREGLRLSG